MNTDVTARLRQAVREYADAVPVTAPPEVDTLLARSGPGRLTGATARWMVPVAAALAVLAAVGVAMLVPRQSEPVPSAVLPWLPAVIERPTGQVPGLPGDRAVGSGSAVYSPCREGWKRHCPLYLVTEDGAQYRLDNVAVPLGSILPTLSPDGRWLGQTREGEYLLRDLTGTEVRRYPGQRLTALAWSSDSRWLVIGNSVGVWRVDIATGQSRTVTAAFASEGTGPLMDLVVDVTRDGDVLLDTGLWFPKPPGPDCLDGSPPPCEGAREMVRVNPARGGEAQWTGKIRAHKGLRPEERSHRWSLLAPGDDLLVVPLGLWRRMESPDAEPGDTETSGDLLLVDLSSGDPIRRFDIPDGRPQLPEAPTGNPDGPFRNWFPIGYDEYGVLLRGKDTHGTWLDRVDPATGELRTAVRAPGLYLVAVRGTASVS